ncbi:bacterial regulatory s, tetR family protein [Mycolicibacterium hassiacum DSM 44199]|jgi:AcrR family transcriptional regulator|uniref:Bacterial regulatory s, tetR family protein n=1 Tax=Mycolicibacterium hassiacum (strain DSM 44199 / CIP 105218 / JCM 12690 / 3849) TaxID=1122247 RepID=K5BHD6_MYCHD|nr:TetR/AcrR family transcriptional regulator [Mycolicibacterium hassiacum]EKF24751.1 bacterial regulatory s, tetR family protein [Mycolicibacterium hassiacum DSM 44199]MBX5486209.1 TetR/AcrR family transcriptional regulator [Mycolicibacterium hassiacum]MDA4086676.1 TetR family transcriptional regulator [Mycolicibacterium hassiacum DSM 44199]PZN24363.1 MAG: TetR/AcrR family transcriptional regulator [Mycolicibacterium hassiacum]VCT88728.1 hypothetical protein MHAS_00412 [Mycolicibacterium hass
MARPARFTVDELLDAAARLLAESGPAAVTMTAVARAAGAPSGSVYHRFSGRAELCAQLWLRTEQRFLAGFTAALTSSPDPRESCSAAALFVVRWCRGHPDEAQVLLAGAQALGAPDWPEPARARHEQLLGELRRALTSVPRDTERVTAAVIDIPYAIVRRHLLAGRGVPPGADAIVADCVRALIGA